MKKVNKYYLGNIYEKMLFKTPRRYPLMNIRKEKCITSANEDVEELKIWYVRISNSTFTVKYTLAIS